MSRCGSCGSPRIPTSCSSSPGLVRASSPKRAKMARCPSSSVTLWKMESFMAFSSQGSEQVVGVEPYRRFGGDGDGGGYGRQGGVLDDGEGCEVIRVAVTDADRVSADLVRLDPQDEVTAQGQREPIDLWAYLNSAVVLGKSWCAVVGCLHLVCGHGVLLGSSVSQMLT